MSMGAAANAENDTPGPRIRRRTRCPTPPWPQCASRRCCSGRWRRGRRGAGGAPLRRRVEAGAARLRIPLLLDRRALAGEGRARGLARPRLVPAAPRCRRRRARRPRHGLPRGGDVARPRPAPASCSARRRGRAVRGVTLRAAGEELGRCRC
ncbi:hypothetical protein PVAP13_8KG082268 [Panicum virgatum]|uniref:Uncharacterized protein n=1 Tax=Panicum virgatum TaxID=38727 RepID=A0A8T0PEE1_PANVG|nr:hypothetical protein PVAP13_8KG082268 [Panicum virgatum]